MPHIGGIERNTNGENEMTTKAIIKDAEAAVAAMDSLSCFFMSAAEGNWLQAAFDAVAFLCAAKMP